MYNKQLLPIDDLEPAINESVNIINYLSFSANLK